MGGGRAGTRGCRAAGALMLAVAAGWWRSPSPSATASGAPDRLLCPDPVRYMSAIMGPAEHATAYGDDLPRRPERVADTGPAAPSRRSARYKANATTADEENQHSERERGGGTTVLLERAVPRPLARLQPVAPARVTCRWPAHTRFEAQFRAAAVRYASVARQFRCPRNPRTGTDGQGGRGYADRPAQLLACDLPFQAVGPPTERPDSGLVAWVLAGSADRRSESGPRTRRRRVAVSATMGEWVRG